MKKRSIVMVLLLTTITLMMGNFTSLSAKTFNLRWSSAEPKQAYLVELFEDWYVKEVVKRTNGRVKIKIYWAGTLCNAKEMPEFVKNGMADVGWITSVYHPGYGDLSGLLPINSFYYDGTAVDLVKKWMQFDDEFPAWRESFAKQNMVPIAYRLYDVFQIWTKKPIKALDDMKGFKVRSVGKTQHAAFSAVGAVPTMIPAAEVFGALQKNILNGMSASVEVGDQYKLYKAVRHMTLLGLQSGTAAWVMNKKKLEQLLPKDQKTLLDIGRELTVKTAQMVEDQRNGRMERIKKEQPDFAFHEFSSAELAKWAKMPKIKQYREKSLADMESKGLPAREGLKLWQEILARSL